MPNNRAIIKVRKYKCLIKTEHGFSRHQFAKPTTNSIHIWCPRQDSNSGHIGRRRVLSHHSTTLAPQQFHISLFSTSELFSTAHDQRTRRAHRAEAPMIGTLFPWLGRGSATFPHQQLNKQQLICLNSLYWK